MRVNVYAEEMTDRVEIIGKEIDGHTFTGLRFYLELPATVNGQQYQGPFVHRPGDDDSSAVTFWGKRDLRVTLRKALAMLDAHYDGSTPRPASVIDEIAAERKRQIEAEGWSENHDDEHGNAELARAAAAYAAHAGLFRDARQLASNYRLKAPHELWPWHHRWWKPKDPRRDLIRAAALIVAEIERLDRKAARA